MSISRSSDPCRETRAQAAFVLCVVAVSLAGASRVAAQESGGVPGADSSAARDTSAAGPRRFLPYPIVFYAPETGIGFGAGAAWYFQRPGSRISSFAPRVLYTTKGQFSISAQLEGWFEEDAWRTFADVGFSRFPTKYWGIGNDTPDDAEEDYTPRSVWLRFRAERRIVSSLYAGARVAFLNREIVETAEDGTLDVPGLVPGADEIEQISVGVTFTWDSRDDVVYPRRGFLLQALLERYPDWLGNDLAYTEWTLDLRGYLPIGRHALAGQALLREVDGTAPFDRLPMFGGDWLIRGYYEGRYRDDVLLAAQVEPRIRLGGRFGLVAFAGAGQVADRLSGIALDGFHVSGGFGVRYRLSRDQKLNVRLDIAFANGSNGLYLNVEEAF